MELRLTVQANAEDCVGALRDAYTTEGNALDVTRETIDFCAGIDRAQFTESVRGAVLLGENAPGVGTVVAVRVRPEIGQRSSENGRGRIEGLLEATVLYMPGGSDLPAAAQAEMPFSIDVPAPIGEDSWISIEVVSAEANALMSDRLEMKTTLNVCCETRLRGRATVVQDAAEGEPIRKRPGIVILWPCEGEDGWSIRQALRRPGRRRDERRRAPDRSRQADRAEALNPAFPRRETALRRTGAPALRKRLALTCPSLYFAPRGDTMKLAYSGFYQREDCAMERIENTSNTIVDGVIWKGL